MKNSRYKFRAWHEDTKKMIDLHKITPLALSDGMNTQMAHMGVTGVFIPFQPDLVIEQFTGLEDKNGTNIYEGDIVDLNGGRCVVEWHEGLAMFWGGWKKFEYLFQYTDMLRVIGNIHENEDLLP